MAELDASRDGRESGVGAARRHQGCIKFHLFLDNTLNSTDTSQDTQLFTGLYISGEANYTSMRHSVANSMHPYQCPGEAKLTLRLNTKPPTLSGKSIIAIFSSPICWPPTHNSSKKLAGPRALQPRYIKHSAFALKYDQVTQVQDLPVSLICLVLFDSPIFLISRARQGTDRRNQPEFSGRCFYTPRNISSEPECWCV